MRRYSWPSSNLASRAASYSGKTIPSSPAPSVILSVWGGQSIPPAVCLLCGSSASAPVAVHAEVTLTYTDITSNLLWQSSAAAATLISAVNRGLQASFIHFIHYS